MADQLALRRSLSEGLSSWLTFEDQCGRSGLFSERYLALPIAQILAANTTGRVVAEHTHPVLASHAPGRPPQLDFAVENDGKVTLAVESKWAGSGRLGVQEVVWDCIRLELAANHYGCDAIFILAGLRGNVTRLLTAPAFNPKTRRGRPALILGLHGQGRLSVNVASPKRAFGPALHRQLQAYPDVLFPQSFVSGHGAQIPRDGTASSWTAAVWSIRPEGPGKRYTFRAQRDGT